MNGLLLSVNQNINKEIPELQNRIKALEEKIVPEEEYFKTATRVNRLIYYILPVALIFFVLGQTLLTVILYMYFGNDDVFNGYVKYILGSVGILGIFEIVWLFIYLPKTMNSLESKISELENRR